MKRTPETAFLPAALEIQETPPSPAGRAILWTIILFFVLAIAWAVFSRVDIVAVARGRIIPTGHSKVVQPLETGTITAIHVEDGQLVKAGDVLIELDPTAAKADLDRFTHERDIASQDVQRYRRMAEWLEAGRGPDERQLQTLDDPLLRRQWREFQDRLAVMEREKAKQSAEARSAREQAAKLKAVLPIVERRATVRKALSHKKLLAEQQYLEAEQARLETLHDLRAQRSRVAELQAAIRELDARITLTRSEFHRQTLERLEEAERRLDTAVQELIKARRRLQAMTLTAPVEGTVQQLAVHTIGAVVTPAQQLLVIVPRNDTLEVEATLENKDVGFVSVGQEAEIKVDAFPFTRYGTLSGKVVDLSNDAVADEKKGLVYKMRVALERSEITVHGKPVRLGPGMTVTAEVKTGTRRLIEFFLSPLLRYARESARER